MSSEAAQAFRQKRVALPAVLVPQPPPKARNIQLNLGGRAAQREEATLGSIAQLCEAAKTRNVDLLVDMPRWAAACSSRPWRPRSPTSS